MSHSRSAGDLRPRKLHSLRSESTTALGSFFEGYQKRQRNERQSLEKQDSVPLSTGSRNREFRRKITIDLQEDTGTDSAISITEKSSSSFARDGPKSGRLDSVTQSLVSITDDYADNSLLKEFHNFTEKLA